MQFLAWLEATSFATWVRESGSIWAYPTILTLHTVGLSFLVGANAVLDLRMLGSARGIPVGALTFLFRFMWIGFAVNAASGIVLFVADATVKGTQFIFFVKLTFIAFALINMRMLRVYLAREAAALAAGIVPLRGRVLAGSSLALWAGAITAGRLMAYIGAAP